jgi:hypothetical protein
MQRISTPFARKVRQFKHLSKQVNRMLENGQFHQLSESRRRSLIGKLRNLYQKLSQVFSGRQLRRALAGAALLLGLSASAQAQNFGPAQVTPFNFSNTGSGYWNLPVFADIDDDGDQDMLMANYIYDENYYMKIRLYENVGTAENPEFAEHVTEPFGIDDQSMFNPVLVDIDNDGDYDLFMGEYGYGNLWFRENTGTAAAPAFGPTQSNPFNLIPLFYVPFLSFTDIDNDGDYDLFATEFYGNMKYFENTGTPEAPSFAAPVNNPFGIIPPAVAFSRTIDFADLDGDGDQDLLYHDLNADEYNSAVFYAENTGTAEAPAFAPGVLAPASIFHNGYTIVQPAFVDIDNDGDEDLFVGTYPEYGGLVYYENLQIDNALPTTQDAEVTTGENLPYTFAAADFPFDDSDGGSLAGIRITGLTSVGSLDFDGAAVTVDQEIAIDDIGLLVFTPNADEFGDNYDSFTFQVSDGEDYSANSATMIIDVEENVNTTETLLDAQVLLTPNPASDLVTIQASFRESPGQLQISIVNALGQSLRSSFLEVDHTEFQTQLQVSDLTPGMYLVQLRAGDRYTTLRLVIE